MNIQFDLGTISIVGLVLGLLFATIGTLDLLKITNLCKFLKTPPEAMMVLAISPFCVTLLKDVGDEIAPHIGQAMFIVGMSFLIAGSIISKRAMKENPHNKSLNSDAS